MRRLIRRRCTLLVAIALVVPALGLLAPSNARASACGSGQHGPISWSPFGDVEAPPSKPSRPNSENKPTKPTPKRRTTKPNCPVCPTAPGAPCQGPWCSGSHAPMPVPTTTLDRPHEPWAGSWADLLLNLRASTPLSERSEHLSRTHHADPIYHPPRAA